MDSSRRPRLSRLPAVAALLAIALLLLLPAAALGADGRTDTAKTTYELLPGQGAIRVTIDVRVENHLASKVQTYSCTRIGYDPYFGYYTYTTTCTRTTRYYINDTAAWIEDTAQQLKVTADSGSVSVKVEKRESGFRLISLKFKSIFKNQVRRIRLTYLLAGGKPRSATAFRAGAAYTSFCAIGNGVDSGSVNVILPGGFNVDTRGGTVTSTTTAGKTTYTSGQVKDPFKFYACFEGTNDSAFKRTTIHSSNGRQLDVEGWPEDTTWNDEIGARVTTAAERLEKLFGRSLPGAGTIHIREASARELGGEYAGVFDPTTQVARITEDLSEESTVAHELAHAWFNKSLFTDTWLDEGYAEWAARTVNQDRLVACNDPGAYPGDGQPSLRDWKYLEPKATQAEEKVVAYNYDASCYLVTQLATAMGEDRMRDVLQYLLDRRIAYLPTTNRLSNGAVPIHTWLDIVDEVGLAPAKADLELAQKLLLKYGIETDATLLAHRSQARHAYHDYLATSVGWSVPEFLAKSMADWRFDDATAALSLAASVRGTVAQVGQTLAGVDAVNGPVKSRVETASSLADLQATQQYAAAQLDAARVAAPVLSTAQARRNPIEDIGLAGVDVSKLSSDTMHAVALGNADEAKADAKQLNDELQGAMQSGAIRVGAAGFGVVGLAGAFVIARRGRRPRARTAMLPQPAERAAPPPTASSDEDAITAKLEGPTDAPRGDPPEGPV